MKGPDLTSTTEMGKTTRVSGTEKLALNIKNALLTDLGSRPDLPNFGSNLYKLKFNLLTEQLLDMTTLYIQQCITTSVPSVALVGIQYDVDYPGRKALIHIKFRDSKSGLYGDTSISFVNGEYTG